MAVFSVLFTLFLIRRAVLASASSGQNQFYNCATLTSKSQPRNTQFDKVLLRTISTALRTEWSSGRAKMEKHAENVTPSTRCDPLEVCRRGALLAVQIFAYKTSGRATQSQLLRVQLPEAGKYKTCANNAHSLADSQCLRLPTSNCWVYKQCTVLPPSFPSLPIAHTITLCTYSTHHHTMHLEKMYLQLSLSQECFIVWL